MYKPKLQSWKKSHQVEENTKNKHQGLIMKFKWIIKPYLDQSYTPQIPLVLNKEFKSGRNVVRCHQNQHSRD